MPKRSSVPQPKLCAMIWVQNPSSVPQPKLCAMIWVQNPSSVPQNKALCHNSKQIIQEFGTSRILKFAEFLSFGTRQLHKLRVFRCQNEALCHNQSSVPQLKANYPRIRHKQNNAKSAAFCSFCVFAGKNAVYLANQSCKDGKSSHVDRTKVSGDILRSCIKQSSVLQSTA